MDKRDIRRKFGQNYLSDPAIIFEMGQSVSPYSGDQFLEVGPGMGALTKTLNKPGIKVKAIDEASKNEKTMVLSGSLSEEDMAKMLIDAQENKISDERFKQLSTLRDWLSSLKIQLVELIDTKTLAQNDIDELIDLKTSIESDYNSENIELLNSLVESGKETIDRLSEKVYQKAKEMMK